MNEEIYPAAEQRMNEYICAHNMRHTQERRTVLRCVCNLKHPFTADQLVEQTAKVFVSQATTYNVIRLLLNARVLHEVQRPGFGGKSGYEVALVSQDSIRMICTKCGREVALADKAISALVRRRRYTNFDMDHYSLYVYGACKVCRRLKGKEKKGQ
ncbi:MAG: transcriptional repressor [Paludibacteraceae bacterium]|nr:transcriptional repressor [Paludibacteraceae bacterium]